MSSSSFFEGPTPPENCASQIVRYEYIHPPDKHGMREMEILVGLKGKEPRTLHKALRFNRFEKKITKVPKQFQKKQYSKKWAAEFYCRPQVSRPKNGLEAFDWIKKNRKHWLRISDVMKMKKGDTMKFLMLDRNFSDITFDDKKNKQGVSFSPSRFFRDQWAIYTHNKDMQGTLKFSWQEKMQGKRRDPIPFEFHVNYATNNWYPFQNGYLPAKSADFGGKLLGKKTHYTQFSPSTPIGWRGPMIPWSKLKNLQKVYWIDE
jgi:hypothetical protein